MQPAGWVIWCSTASTTRRKKSQERSAVRETQNLCTWESASLGYLHLGVHAVVDHRSPHVGRTYCDDAIATRGQHRSFVLVKGLQWGVVARVLQLQPGNRDVRWSVVRCNSVCVNLMGPTPVAQILPSSDVFFNPHCFKKKTKNCCSAENTDTHKWDLGLLSQFSWQWQTHNERHIVKTNDQLFAAPIQLA